MRSGKQRFFDLRYISFPFAAFSHFSSLISHLSSPSPMSSITKKETGGYADRFWYPRFWDGMTAGAWFRVLHKGKYRVAPVRWAMAGLISALAVGFNTPFAALSRLLYDRRIRDTELVAPPIFIIGHWRSGTPRSRSWIRTPVSRRPTFCSRNIS